MSRANAEIHTSKGLLSFESFWKGSFLMLFGVHWGEPRKRTLKTKYINSFNGSGFQRLLLPSGD
jgi:hypothetical protein